MSNTSDLDRNFKVNISYQTDAVNFYDVNSEPFKLYGLIYEDGEFRRMPKHFSGKVSDGVHFFSTSTSGGRIRFVTDSDEIFIKTELFRLTKSSNMSLTGAISFDLYVSENGQEKFGGVFMPPFDIESGYESNIKFPDSKKRIITINFPLYTSVKKLFIGLKKEAEILSAPDYKIKAPIVYYGSSITQGAVASRPGNTYPAIISQKLNCDFINFGFSGNAKGEIEMAEYISKLDMSAFVYDYDHNAETEEELMKTHKRMFEVIRRAKPNLPIIILSRIPQPFDDKQKFRDIVKQTYLDAKANNDQNVFYIDGKDLFNEFVYENIVVDGVHPNDIGFACMAEKIISILSK